MYFHIVNNLRFPAKKKCIYEVNETWPEASQSAASLYYLSDEG